MELFMQALCKTCSLIGLRSCLEAPVYISRTPQKGVASVNDSPDVTTSTDAPVFQSQLQSNRVTPDNAHEIQTSASNLTKPKHRKSLFRFTSYKVTNCPTQSEAGAISKP